MKTFIAHKRSPGHHAFISWKVLLFVIFMVVFALQSSPLKGISMTASNSNKSCKRDISKPFLMNNSFVNPDTGFSVRFKLSMGIKERLALWLGHNGCAWVDRSGIEIVFHQERVQINVKYPGGNWITLPPAVLNKPIQENDVVEIRIFSENIIEILTNRKLRAKFFLGEILNQAFPEGYGRLPGGGIGMQVLWQGGAMQFSDVKVTPLPKPFHTGYRISKSYRVSTYPYHVTASDLNKDGIDDLVITNRGIFDGRVANNYISILYGNPNNTFDSAINYEVGQGPYMAEVADINNDGIADILTACFYSWTGRNITVLVGVENGFAPGNPWERNLPLQSYSRNGSFKTSFLPLPHVKPLIGKAIAPYQADQAWPIPGITSLVMNDFNRDGFQDIAAVGWTNDVLYILLGDGKGQFRLHGIYQDKRYGYGFRDIKSTDIDGDGKSDLAITCYVSSHVLLFRGNGDATFQFKHRYGSGGTTAYHLNFGDFNRDKKPDIIVGNYSGTIKLIINEGNFEFSDGGVYSGFGSVWEEDADTQTSDGWNDYWKVIRDVVPHDFNDDGHLDVAIASAGPNSGYFCILWGTGNNKKGKFFGESVQYYLGKRPRSIFIGDFNNDGLKDEVIIVRRNANDVLLLTKKKN